MLLSLVDELRHQRAYPELAGCRVLITGLTSRFGIDIARAFADHNARIVLHANDCSPQMDEISKLLSESANEMAIYNGAFEDHQAAVRFAQGPAQKTFGGLDTAINLITLSSDDLAIGQDFDDIEDLMTEKLSPVTMMSRVIANRMRLTLTPGVILNVLATVPPKSESQQTLISMITAALGTITRREAQNWADQDIRLNAVGPALNSEEDIGSSGSSLQGEPEIGALALFLSSNRGNDLSGLVFDTENVCVNED